MRVITWKRVGLAATVVVVGGTLAATGRVAARADRATPEPLGAQRTRGCDPNQSHTALLAEARSLNYGTSRGSEDTQVLWWFSKRGDSTSEIVPGPVGTAWPRDRGHDRELDADGFFVAMVKIEGGHGRDGYPKLGLPEGFSFVKICKPIQERDSLLALIVTESGVKEARVRRSMRRDRPPVAKALWEWHPEDDHLCVSCGPWWCELF